MRITDKAVIAEASRHQVFTARSLCDALGIPDRVRSMSRRLKDLADAGAIRVLCSRSPAVYCPADSGKVLSRQATSADVQMAIRDLGTFTLDDVVLECARRGLSDADYRPLQVMLNRGEIVRDRRLGERWEYRLVEPCA